MFDKKLMDEFARYLGWVTDVNGPPGTTVREIGLAIRREMERRDAEGALDYFVEMFDYECEYETDPVRRKELDRDHVPRNKRKSA